MESKRELGRNPQALILRITLFTISFIVLGIISIWILTIPFRLGDNRFLAGTLAIMILAVLGLMLSITIIKKKWSSVRYFITDSAIIISYGNSSYTEDVYRFDSILSASIRQTPKAKKFGYGDIILRGPHLEKDIVLQDINQPTLLASNIHQKLAHNSTNPTALTPNN